MDRRSERAVSNRGRGRLDVGDQVGGIVLAGLGQVDLVAHPLGGALPREVRVWVVGRTDEEASRRKLLVHAPAYCALQSPGVLLNPDLPKRLDSRYEAGRHGIPRKGRALLQGLAACGRARWKIENESFNVLKNNGYNLEHNFGHGKVNLSAVFVSLNLLAFAFHTVCDLAEDLWRKAMEKMGSRSRFFENLRSITTFLIFPTWDDLLATLAFARPPPTAL